MDFEIEGQKIGQKFPPYIIAELSANHNGSIERAFKTIDAAKKNGADAIKIQSYTPDTMTINCDKKDFLISGGLWDGYKLYDLYKWAHTPFEWHQEIFEYARKKEITLFSTPFDETAVDLLESLKTPAYKIASFEVTDLPLIRYVAQTGKPMIMSTGMANQKEIKEAVSTAREAGCKELALLHCVSAYPAKPNQANIRQIAKLAHDCNVISGLSDHTLGNATAIASIACGASIIEKHFTLDRKDKGPDSEFSIEPYELNNLCSECRDAWSSLGQAGYDRPIEEKSSMVFRRSIYFVKDLRAGSIIEEGDIRRIRPGMGLKPKYFDDLIGKKVKTDVKRGTATNWDLFDD